MRAITAIAATTATLLALTGCAGATEDTGGAGESGESVAVTVGIIPVAEFFPVYIAEQEGYFEELGLDVTIESLANAASIVPSVLNGQLTFGAAATPPFLTAVEKKIPIVGVANAGNTTQGDGSDTGAFIVGADSDIESLADLSGRTVAVNALSSLPHVAGAARLADEGVDVASVQFVAMPFNDMQAALEQGRVDALLSVEPFMSQTIGAGSRQLSPLYLDVYQPGTTHTLYFASSQFAQQNPEVVEKFRKAVAKANDLVASDDSVLRAALVEFGGMPQETADAVRLPAYETEFNVDGMTEMAAKMKRNGFLTGDVDVDAALLK